MAVITAILSTEIIYHINFLKCNKNLMKYVQKNTGLHTVHGKQMCFIMVQVLGQLIKTDSVLWCHRILFIMQTVVWFGPAWLVILFLALTHTLVYVQVFLLTSSFLGITDLYWPKPAHALLCCYVESHHHRLMQDSYLGKPIKQHFAENTAIKPLQVVHKRAILYPLMFMKMWSNMP